MSHFEFIRKVDIFHTQHLITETLLTLKAKCIYYEIELALGNINLAVIMHPKKTSAILNISILEKDWCR